MAILTRAKFRILELANYSRTPKQIADIVGVTREYVRQVRKELGLQAIIPAYRYRLCKVCGQPIPKHRGYCPSCLWEKQHFSTVCIGCGQPFNMTIAELHRRLRHNPARTYFYHSRLCYRMGPRKLLQEETDGRRGVSG